MDATLAGLDIEDPTAGANEEEISAPGVTQAAVDQKLRQKAEKKEKRKKEKALEVAAATGEPMDVDSTPKDKKKRKSEGVDEVVSEKKKKKKSKAE